VLISDECTIHGNDLWSLGWMRFKRACVFVLDTLVLVALVCFGRHGLSSSLSNLSSFVHASSRLLVFLSCWFVASRLDSRCAVASDRHLPPIHPVRCSYCSKEMLLALIYMQSPSVDSIQIMHALSWDYYY
jgi:hypothetical protein